MPTADHPSAPPPAPESVRNVGICAHIDAGKTTLTERILHLTGRERYVGRVDEGTSVMDWMAEERERGITITAAATRVPWRGYDFNLVDTPGHVDFTVEVERCMRVLDGAILVLDAAKGVEPQTETVWRQVDRQLVPAIAFANKCERPGADPLACVQSMAERLGVRALVIAYPLGGGDSGSPLAGIVDLVQRAAFSVGAPIEIPGGVADEIDVLRAELIDALADLDDGIFEVVCAGAEPTPAELAAGLRRVTLARRAVPLLCGAALPGQGVPLLLDAIAAYLPSPPESRVPDLFAARGAEPPVPGAPLPMPLLLAFKVHSTLSRGRRRDLNFVRIYSGSVRAGTRLWNDRSGVTEEVEGVLRVHASEVEHIDEAYAGDVVALAGLSSTGIGDTLTGEGSHVRLEPPRLPHPVLGYVLEPVRDQERLELGEALEQLAHEDPSLRVSEDRASGQWLLEGMGELHLEIALGRLRAEFGVEPRVGPPRVAFRESVRRAARGVGLVDRTFGDQRGYAEVRLRLEPLPVPSQRLEFADPGRGPEVEPGARFLYPSGDALRAMRVALRGEAESGPVAGHPLVGVRMHLDGGQALAGAVVETAWVQAAVAALRDALKAVAAKGGVTVLEPRMAFVVDSPVDVASGVIGDLNSRGADMDEVVATGLDGRRISGMAPLRTLVGYSTDLRSLSRGRATFTMRPAGFAPHADGTITTAC